MEQTFLKDLAIVIAVAGVMTLICRLLRQPVVIGYLIAGLIIGPHTPPFTLVNDLHSIQTMAELGLVILMFVLGLEFSLPKLRKVGLRATLATVLEIVGMLAIGYAVGRGLGWNANDSIYLGAILSISSTTIIVKVLTDLRLTQETFAQVVLAILILEDIAAVVILTLLSGLGASQETQGVTILRAVGGVSFFVAVFLILGLALVPALLRRLARFNSNEMTGLVALGLCLGSALLAAHFGFSVALGAFLIGAVIGVSPEVERIEAWIHPLRDLFSAMFFVSAGLLIDPKLLWDIKGPVVLVTLVTIAGKIAAGTLGASLAGFSLKTSARIGVTLAQIGEFSFVFASLGLKSGLASEHLYPLAVAVSGITTVTTPYLIRYSDTLVETLVRWAPNRFTRVIERRSADSTASTPPSHTFKIVSRYLWRLGIHCILLATGFWATALVDHALVQSGVAVWYRDLLWVMSWTVNLLFIHAVAGYLNHCLLLLLTEWLSSSRVAPLWHKVPIQLAYDVSERVIWLALAALWLKQSALPAQGPLLFIAALVGMGVVTWLAKKPLERLSAMLEDLLDEIMGLASSEPLRQAALETEGPGSLLKDSIQRILLPKHSEAVGKSLREAKLRERTGASVIGIYRDGALGTNPSPETVLAPNDILVILGDGAECEGAAAWLTKRSTS